MTRQESIDAILAASDDGGTIQASDMLALSRAGAIPNDPRLHTTMNVLLALQAAGLTEDEANQVLES